MRRMRRWFWSLMVLSMGVAIGAQAETLAEYTFTGEVATPSTANAFIDAAAVTISAGTTTFASANEASWTGSGVPYIRSGGGWTAASQGDAKHFVVSLSEKFGATFSITNISVRKRATNAGPSAFGISVNGTSVYVESQTNNVTEFVSVPVSGFDDLEEIEIRFQGWLDGSRTTTGGGELHVDDILIQGTVDAPAGNFPPSVATPSWADRTDTTVTLSANITATGGPDVIERGFVYSTTQGFDPVNEGTSVFEDEGPYGTGVFSLPLTGLDPDTVYYFVGYAVNNEGTGYTTETSFETLAPPPPNALVYYTFTDNSLAAEVVAADVDATEFAVSANPIEFGFSQAADWEALGSDNPYVQSSGNWNAANQDAAKNFLFTLTADEGQAITITNISFIHRRTTAGPQNTGIRINGASVHSQTLADASTEAVSVVVAGQVNLTNAVIQFDGWNGTGSAPSGDYRLDNVLVQGFVDAAVVADIPPTVTTPTAIDIVGGSATLGGTIADEGDATVIERGVFWSTTEDFDVGDATKVGESGAFSEGVFTIAVSGMPPVTDIYFRAFARNAAGYGLSDEDSFTTGTIAPAVDSPSVANVMTTSATLGGTIVATGGEQVVDIGVIYSDDPNFDPNTEGVTVTDTGDFAPGSYTFGVTGLDPDTEYTFVFFAVNLTGTGYTEKGSFTTMPPPPADLLAYYTFADNSPEATFWDPGITALELTASSGSISYGWFQSADWEALGATEPYAFSSGGWAETTREEAKYLSFSLETMPGTPMTITNISFLHRRQTTGGPLTVGVSINGTSVYEDDIAALATTYLVSIPVSGFDEIADAEIRIEGWNGGNGEYRFDNILVQGTMGAGPPPEDPDFIDIEFFGGAVSLTFGSKVGYNYQLEFITDLTEDPLDWQPVPGPEAAGEGVGDELQLGDEDMSDTMRIYRVVETPPL